MRTAIATACLGLLIGAGLAGCGPTVPVSAPPEPSTSDSPTASAPVSPGPSAAEPGPPATAPIPDSAFFKPPANRTRETPARAQTGIGHLPEFCGGSPMAKPVQVRNRTLTFFGLKAPADSIPDGTVAQTIATYHPGDADHILDRFRSAVVACPEEKLDTGAAVSYRVLPPYALGDETVLIERTWTNPPDFPDKTISLVAVVRVGSAVTFLAVDGWEGINADATVTRDYTKLAVEAVQRWRSS